MKKRLFILVEGEDDVRFFGRIVKPLFTGRYDSVEIVPYASIKREKVSRFIKSIRLMKNDYIFVSDIDAERSVADKKQILYYRYSDVEGKRIIIVIQEIESWYLAGLSDHAARKLGMDPLMATDEITKEDFNRLIPKRFNSRIDFMFEILKFFSLPDAAAKNRSFSFFAHRYYLGAESDLRQR
ncbi:MAG: hypothetical protein A4E35_00489 [Methanoregula sp. PtaU1.Bin051]|nr:MAG: hypothetical protein A4E35_00489 [Methanoregula sp. PtaU1.Bin051]